LHRRKAERYKRIEGFERAEEIYFALFFFILAAISLFIHEDIFTKLSFRLLISLISTNFNFSAIIIIFLDSPHDHLAMYRNLTNSLSVSLSYHSAILFDIERMALNN
jgi:hypothetical protein